MRQLVVMEKSDSVADLEGHVSDVVNGIRQEVVCFQKVKGAERQQLKGDAHMAVVVKPVKHLNTVMFIVWIFLTDLLQHIDFLFGCFSVLLNILNDLQRRSVSTSSVVQTVNNLPKSPLT